MIRRRVRTPSPRPALVLVVGALALVTGMTGCLGDGEGPDQATSGDRATDAADPGPSDLTKPTYEEIIREETTVAGHEGTPIWTEIYRPEVPDDVEVPVILVMSPYIGSIYAANGIGYGLSSGEDCDQPPLLDRCPPAYHDQVAFFVERGYAFAFASVRGTHNSGGCIENRSRAEQMDAYHVVERLADRPWSNGRVGMTGISYDGGTSISAAIHDPPSLETIVPHASLSSYYDWVYDDGVPYASPGLVPTGPSGLFATALAMGLPPGQDPAALERLVERTACQDEQLDAHLEHSGDMTAYWQERDMKAHASDVRTAVLQTHGFQDGSVAIDQVDGWFDALDNATEKHLLLGQWGHTSPAAELEAWDGQGGLLHRWMDHFLQERETGLLDDLPPVMIQNSTDRWRGLESFPPDESDNTVMHPTPDGVLAKHADSSGMAPVWDAPRERAGSVRPAMDAIDRGSEETGRPPTRLVFTSDPLEEPLAITGTPTVTIDATTDEPGTRWAASLATVGDEGPTELSYGYQNTRHLGGVREPQTVPAGTPYEATVTLQPTDAVIPEGHRLELTLSNWDDRILQDDTYAESKIRLGAETNLVLPLSPGGPAWTPAGASLE